MIVEGIEADPAWQGGDYRTQPVQGGSWTASDMTWTIAGSAPHQQQ